MILLLDFDSVLYQAVYRAVSIQEMRSALSDWDKAAAKQWLLEEVYSIGINRCQKQIEEIKSHVQSMVIDEITDVELYITTCSNSFRKKLAPSYKANRKRNKYVWMLREHYAINGAMFSDTHEADDLIANRARELGTDNCIVVSIDKDLQQIGGFYWSYYRQRVKDDNGHWVINEFGYPEREYKQQQIRFIERNEADKLFWVQMLMGDNSDNIKGLKRVGIKTAQKILANSENYFITVAREYLKRDKKELFRINYKLMKL